MKINKNDIPVVVDAGENKVRHKYDFGSASGLDTFAGEHYTLCGGSDFTPLLKGLEGDLCQCPHWGYVIKGEMEVIYTNGDTETYVTGDLFYMAPGHTLKVPQDTECVMFSPQKEHCAVVDHINKQLAAV